MKPMEENKDIFVLAESEDGKIASITFELLNVGRDLADTIGGIFVR